MKKVLAVLLSVMMILAVASCKKKAEPLADDSHDAWVLHGSHLLADGTENSWNGKDNAIYEKSALKAISIEDVKEIDEELYKALSAKEKDIKYLYTIDVIFGTNDAGWPAPCLIDGVLYSTNGSYCFKVAQCNIEVDGDDKVYGEDVWISDPKIANAESLTPKTLFMPVWQEEPDEFGFSWASNPVCIGGPGLYTLVIAQYKTVSAAGVPGYGIALVKKEEKEGLPYEEVKEWIPGDHTYGVIGDFNEWSADVAMTADGENTWKATVELKAGQGIKVRADGAWDNSWGAGNDNVVVEEDGTYEVVITFGDEVTVTATKK